MKFVNLLVPMVVASFLSGCAGFQQMRQETQQKVDADQQAVQAELSKAGTGRRPGAVEYVSGPWIVAGKPVPINSGKVLPSSFDRFVYTFDDRVSVATLAERITALGGVPVRIAPDVFLPSSRLLPLAAAGAGMVPSAPSAGGREAAKTTTNAVTDNEYGLTYKGPFQGPLANLLDTVTTKAGITWEYRDGTIRLFRTTTKTFPLHVLPGSTNVQASVGKGGSATAGAQSSAGGAGGGGGSITSNSQSSSTIQQSAMEKIEATVKTMLSPIGKHAVTSAGVTVTDTFDVVERVGNYIALENAGATQQISFKVEVISWRSTQVNDFGLDWTVVANKMKGISPSSTLTLQSPQSSLSSTAGSIGYSILSGDAGAPNTLSGTQLLFKALSSVGTTRLSFRTSRTTANNQPTAIAIYNTDGYLARTTPASSTLGGTGGAPGLEPGSVTTGLFLNLVPTIIDGDRVMVQFSFDNSALRGKIPTYSSGGQSIMVPNYDGLDFLDRIGPLRAGQTAVLTAYERTTHAFSKQGVFDGGNFGESSGQLVYEAILVFLTPIIVEG